MNIIIDYITNLLLSILKKKYCTLFLCYNLYDHSKDLYYKPKEKSLNLINGSISNDNIYNTLYQLVYNGILTYINFFI